MKHLVKPTWTWSKRLIMVGFILPVVLLLAFVGAVSVLDFNQYKPQIESTLSEQLGQKVTVKGRVEVSLYPFAFSLGQFSVSQPELSKEKSAVESPAWLTIRTVRAELDLWAFLSEKRVNVKGLELIEPHLLWSREETLSQELSKDREAFKSHEGGDRTALVNGSEHVFEVDSMAWMQELKSLPNWRFQSLVVTDGSMEIVDDSLSHHARLQNLNLLAFNVSLRQPFRIRTDFSYHNVTEDRLYEFDLSAKLQLKDNLSTWSLQGWQGIFNLTLSPELQIPKMRMVTSGQNLTFSLEEERVRAEGVVLGALGAKIHTSFTGSMGKNPHFYGSLSIQKLDAQKWARQTGLSLPTFQDETALTQIVGKLDWRLAGGEWALNNIALSIDDTQFRGRVWQTLVEDVQTERSKELEFDIQAERINLDRYVALKSALVENGDKQSGEEQMSYMPIWDGLFGLIDDRLQGHLFAKQVVWQGLTIEALDAHVATPKEGVIEVAPLDAQLYQGELNSKLSFNFAKEQTEFAWSGQLAAVKLGSLLKDGLGKKPLSGLSHLHFNLQGQAASRFEWKNDLSGSVTLRSNQGSVYGLDLPKLLAGTALQSTDHTAFDSLLIKGDLRKGALKTKQFKLRSSQLFGNGVGEFDLVKHQANTQMQLRLQKLSGDAKPYQGMLLPMQIRGDLSLPRWSVDKAALQKARGNPKKKVEALLKALP